MLPYLIVFVGWAVACLATYLTQGYKDFDEVQL